MAKYVYKNFVLYNKWNIIQVFSIEAQSYQQLDNMFALINLFVVIIILLH